jgi:cytochrome P450
MSWESRLHLAAHPVAYPLVRAVGRIGPVVRVPRVGVVVSDAALAKEVLNDPVHFTKTGPGSPADLWTPVVGPTVLLNMEGAAHGDLRRKLSGLFTPRSVSDLCGAVLDAPVEELRSALRAGRPVDLVAVVRRLVGAVICELVGLEVSEAVAAHVAGTAITSTAGPPVADARAGAAVPAVAGCAHPAGSAGVGRRRPGDCARPDASTRTDRGGGTRRGSGVRAHGDRDIGVVRPAAGGVAARLRLAGPAGR